MYSRVWEGNSRQRHTNISTKAYITFKRIHFKNTLWAKPLQILRHEIQFSQGHIYLAFKNNSICLGVMLNIFISKYGCVPVYSGLKRIFFD